MVTPLIHLKLMSRFRNKNCLLKTLCLNLGTTKIPNPDQFAPVPPIPKEIPPAPRDNEIRDPQPPPIPPMPKGYKKTCIKDLGKKHKEVKKTIKQLEKELDKLYIEKIHLDGCIGYFNDDSEDFMKQINLPSPPPDDPSPPHPQFLLDLKNIKNLLWNI